MALVAPPAPLALSAADLDALNVGCAVPLPLDIVSDVLAEVALVQSLEAVKARLGDRLRAFYATAAAMTADGQRLERLVVSSIEPGAAALLAKELPTQTEWTRIRGLRARIGMAVLRLKRLAFPAAFPVMVQGGGAGVKRAASVPAGGGARKVAATRSGGARTTATSARAGGGSTTASAARLPRAARKGPPAPKGAMKLVTAGAGADAAGTAAAAPAAPAPLPAADGDTPSGAAVFAAWVAAVCAAAAATPAIQFDVIDASARALRAVIAHDKRKGTPQPVASPLPPALAAPPADGELVAAVCSASPLTARARLALALLWCMGGSAARTAAVTTRSVPLQRALVAARVLILASRGVWPEEGDPRRPLFAALISESSTTLLIHTAIACQKGRYSWQTAFEGRIVLWQLVRGEEGSERGDASGSSGDSGSSRGGSSLDGSDGSGGDGSSEDGSVGGGVGGVDGEDGGMDDGCDHCSSPRSAGSDAMDDPRRNRRNRRDRRGLDDASERVDLHTALTLRDEGVTGALDALEIVLHSVCPSRALALATAVDFAPLRARLCSVSTRAPCNTGVGGACGGHCSAFVVEWDPPPLSRNDARRAIGDAKDDTASKASLQRVACLGDALAEAVRQHCHLPEEGVVGVVRCSRCDVV